MDMIKGTNAEMVLTCLDMQRIVRGGNRRGWFVISVLMLFATSAFADYESALKAHDAFKFTQAFKEFKRLAEQGDKRAQYYVGRMLHLGEGIGQDKQEAYKWYLMSAQQGFARAQNNLGALYFERGEIDAADFWFKKAAAQGLPQAQNNLKLVRKYKVKRPSPEPRANTQIMPDPTMEFRFNRLREGMH